VTMFDDRAQTTLDFATGVGIFLVVVASVFAFVPGMLEPFASSTQEETAAANRIADNVAGSLLADPDEPYLLDPVCTQAFFHDDPENTNGDNTLATGVDPGGQYQETLSTSACNFEDVDLDERLGIAATGLKVRVELVADVVSGELDNPDHDDDEDFNGDPVDDEPDTVCYDYGDDRYIEAGDPFDGGTECDLTGGDDDVLVAVGDDPPSSSGSIVTSRRTVGLEGVFGDGTDDATVVVEVWK